MPISDLKIDPKGSPADVPGFTVGHAELKDHPSGLSVVLCPEGAVAGVDVRGSAPGSRQMDSLDAMHIVDTAQAVLLTGGSSFGLGATDGVQDWLIERKAGIRFGPVTLPIIPTAVIFDLPLTRGMGRPGPETAYQACQNAGNGPMARGNVGVGAGATVGNLFGLTHASKGGLGGASLTCGELKMGAMAVVNALGDVVDEQGRVIAGIRSGPESTQLSSTSAWYLGGYIRDQSTGQENTTLAVVTTNARLNKLQAVKVASLAHHGLVRALSPCHTMLDGDLVIVLSGGDVPADLNGVGVMASHLVEAAIRDGIRSAKSLPGIPAAEKLTPCSGSFNV